MFSAAPFHLQAWLARTPQMQIGQAWFLMWSSQEQAERWLPWRRWQPWRGFPSAPPRSRASWFQGDARCHATRPRNRRRQQRRPRLRPAATTVGAQIFSFTMEQNSVRRGDWHVLWSDSICFRIPSYFGRVLGDLSDERRDVFANILVAVFEAGEDGREDLRLDHHLRQIHRVLWNLTQRREHLQQDACLWAVSTCFAQFHQHWSVWLTVQ